MVGKTVVFGAKEVGEAIEAGRNCNSGDACKGKSCSANVEFTGWGWVQSQAWL